MEDYAICSYKKEREFIKFLIILSMTSSFSIFLVKIAIKNGEYLWT